MGTRVDQIDALLYNMINGALRPFEQTLTLPAIMRRFRGGTVAKPKKKETVFVPEAGDIVDIEDSHLQPDSEEPEGQWVDIPMEKWRGIRFQMSARDIHEVMQTKGLVIPETLHQNAVKLANEINLFCLRLLLFGGFNKFTRIATPEEKFKTKDKFNANFWSGTDKKLNESSVPEEGRHMLMSASDWGQMRALDLVTMADQRGEASAANRHPIGMLGGTQMTYENELKNRAAQTDGPTVDGALLKGATKFVADGADRDKMAVGDVFTHNSAFHIITDKAATPANHVTYSIFPAFTAAVTDNLRINRIKTEIALHAHRSAGAFISSFINTREAFGENVVSRQAMRRDRRFGIGLMIHRFEQYHRMMYEISAYYGGTILRDEAIEIVG